MPVARIRHDRNSAEAERAWIKETQDLAKLVLTGRSGVRGIFLPLIFVVGTLLVSIPILNKPFLYLLRRGCINGSKRESRRGFIGRVADRLARGVFYYSMIVGLPITVLASLKHPESKWGLAGLIFLLLVFAEAWATDQSWRPTETTKASAPKWGTYLLYLFLSRQERDGLLGDLEEGYQEVHTRFGTWAARVWYWKQVLTSLWPLLLRAVSTLIKVGALGWIKHLTERFIH